MKVYTSIAQYSGDMSISQNLFLTEKEALEDCKKQFDASVKEGEENGDMEDYDWCSKTNSGHILWADGDASYFEMQEIELPDGFHFKAV